VEYVNRWNWGRVNHDLQAEYGIDRGLSGASENWLGTKSGKQNIDSRPNEIKRTTVAHYIL
jgi:hypothetical protein